ncbi:La- protein 4 [Podila verticillata]|nr:La- protein 4 [Podila verticillata]
MNGVPGGSCQQERPPHRKHPSIQGGARSTKFYNRIPLPRSPYDVNRNTSLHHCLPEEYTIIHNRGGSYLASLPSSASDIHFLDGSFNKGLSYPTSRSELPELPEDGFWRSTMMGPPPETPYPYSMPWGPPYHGPPMPMPMRPTPHYEATQDDQDDVEIILGPEQEPSSAFSASAGAPEYDKGRDRLREQLEFYFSPSNLAVDAFLVSHMNAERYVPISVIADFKRVKAVTFDMDEIIATLRRSSVVIVDETGTLVKPEISDLFKDAKCPAKEIVKEVGNTWFVEFETPEEALAMLSYIRGKSLRGVPLAGRLKSNTAFTGGLHNAIVPKRPVEQMLSSSPTELNEHGPTMDGGWMSSSSDTADYSPPYGRPTYRRFPLEPEDYSPYITQGTWSSTTTEPPFYDISSSKINPAKGSEAQLQGLPPMKDMFHQGQQWTHPDPYMIPHLSPPFGGPTERHPSTGQFASNQGPLRWNSDSGHSSNYERKKPFDKGGPSGPRDSNSNDSYYRLSTGRNSFSSDQQKWREPGGSGSSLPLIFVDDSGQERHSQNSSGNAIVLPREPQESVETHYWQDAPAPWVATQPAPSSKSKSKNKNQKKKNKKKPQDNKVTADPVDTVAKKLADMTADEDKPDKAKSEKVNSEEDKPAQPKHHHHHKDGNDNPNTRHSFKNKNNKSNSRASTSGTSSSPNNKSGKGTKHTKKEKEFDFSRALILKLDNFPPLSSAHLPTSASHAHIELSSKGSQTAKKTKWQPITYDVTPTPRPEQKHSKGRPHGDGEAKPHTEPARVKKAYPTESTSTSTVAPPQKAPEEPSVGPKPTFIPSAIGNDDASIDPSIDIASGTDTTTTTVAPMTSVTTLTTTTAPPKAMTAPTSPTLSYASALKRSHDCRSALASEAGVDNGGREGHSSQ